MRKHPKRPLTTLQQEIIMHRLEVPDCIAEALERPEDEVDEAVKNVITAIRSGRWLDGLNELERDVFVDAIEGCTYLANAIGQQRRRLDVALTTIAERAAVAFNRIVRLPPECERRAVPPLSRGDRIRLVEMGPDPDPIPTGTTGTVEEASIVHAGDPGREYMQVLVKWDAKRSLILVCPPDRYEVI